MRTLFVILYYFFSCGIGITTEFHIKSDNIEELRNIVSDKVFFHMDRLKISDLETEVVKFLEKRNRKKEALKEIYLLQGSSRKFNIIKKSLEDLVNKGLIETISYSAPDNYRMPPKAVAAVLEKFVYKNVNISTQGTLSAVDEVSSLSTYFENIRKLHDRLPDLSGIVTFDSTLMESNKIRIIKTRIQDILTCEIPLDITVINLCGLRLDNEDSEDILSFIREKNISSIELINLAANKLTANIFENLEHILDIPSLKFLNIRHNPAAQASAVMEFCQQLIEKDKTTEACKLIWVPTPHIESDFLIPEAIESHRQYGKYISSLWELELDNVSHKVTKHLSLY